MKPPTQIRKLLHGLTFMSESDYPFIVKRETNHEELNTEEFFDRLIEQDTAFEPAVKWFKENLSDIQVTRTGRVQITYEIAGRTRDGEWLRIQTIGIET